MEMAKKLAKRKKNTENSRYSERLEDSDLKIEDDQL